jgi:hypothetical protein
MLVREYARLWCDAVTASVTPKPKALAQAFQVRKMDLPPGVILWFGVPHRI